MNRISAEQLSHSLNDRLAKIYYLVGQDPLLINESRDLIFDASTPQGFDEKTEISLDSGTDWNGLFEQVQSMGLFFERQVIILNLPENLTALLQTQLQKLVTLLHSDILLILSLPKLTKLMERQDWFVLANQYESQAILVNCQTPTPEQLPRWVSNRAKSMNLDIDDDAIKLLCYSYENNLLALKQALQMLALLYPDQKLNFSRTQNVVEQSSIFTPFQWIDALLGGKHKRAKRILEGLKAEDIQPVILLRMLQRELITILQLTQPQQREANIDMPLSVFQLRERFDHLKIWQNRRPLFSLAIQRLSYRRLYEVIQTLANIERLAKQEFSDEIWEQLADITTKMC
ncbi:DNA polymerase III subunit delta [Rodentibacter caecimuris]|uniref:DNA polymerase III subunit delta n=1 Tax=Rodentibacter caecimuris TaxID=1796644 RepID=A0ABX3KV39_9PAST|nr:DNA polymerase III subunit delta [Rodentibacter heylii]